MFKLFTVTALAVLGLFAASPARATVLPFNEFTEGQELSQYPTYGDNVASASQGGYTYGGTHGFTPNVVLDYGASPNGLYMTASGAGEPRIIAGGPSGTAPHALILDADPSYTVTLHNFDSVVLGAVVPFDITVFVDGVQAAFFDDYIPANETLGEGNGIYGWAPGSITSVPGGNIRIEWFAGTNSGNTYNSGFDNFAFSQAIPEPASLGALLVGGVALFSRRRLARV